MEQENHELVLPARWKERLRATALNLVVVPAPGEFSKHSSREATAVMASLVGPQDNFDLAEPPFSGAYDAVVAWRPCGRSRTTDFVAGLKLPVMTLMPSLSYHPFHAVMHKDLQKRGLRVLKSTDPETTRASIDALRAYKALRGMKLIVIDDHIGDSRGAEIAAFGKATAEKFGVGILHHSADELLARAADQNPEAVEAELERWWREVYVDKGEVSHENLLQSVRLYLGLKELLIETGAAGVSVDDIGSFLLGRRDEFPGGVMPNLAYGVLVNEGYLACEEGDIEVLMTELLLAMAYGQQPTMSNIYLSYLDAFDASSRYLPEEEAADLAQCRLENVVVAAHFSTSGVLPPEMREEDKLPVRETIPSWAGQGMMAGTPKLGPVRLARLDESVEAIHSIPGEVTSLRFDESKHWYRGRWIIRIPSVDDFIEDCIHQHYAIGPARSEAPWRALLTLTGLKEL